MGLCCDVLALRIRVARRLPSLFLITCGIPVSAASIVICTSHVVELYPTSALLGFNPGPGV